MKNLLNSIFWILSSTGMRAKDRSQKSGDRINNLLDSTFWILLE